MSDTTLDGRTAVVTGASRGVGRALADALEARGVHVARVSRTAGYACDVSSRKDVGRLARRVRRALDTPTILINAAGEFGPLEPIGRVDPDAWIETLHVNTVGPFLTCRVFVGGMVAAGWGRIVNVSSAASLHTPGPLGSAYATSKAALNHLTRHLAAELEGTGVTANVLHPGDLRTGMWADIGEKAVGLGPEARTLVNWFEWVESTGGDGLEKAVDLVLGIIRSDANGRFLWIEQPLQAPTQSW